MKICYIPPKNRITKDKSVKLRSLSLLFAPVAIHAFTYLDSVQVETIAKAPPYLYNFVEAALTGVPGYLIKMGVNGMNVVYQLTHHGEVLYTFNSIAEIIHFAMDSLGR